MMLLKRGTRNRDRRTTPGTEDRERVMKTLGQKKECEGSY